ncbi:MAG: dihydrolipoyl dehydrogenase [Candidatus Rokuibacteriota bacterium]|nr:MAG: dihydrolipoyl dehydrogenase [Candidatus Rokubacteria bacterium]PYM55022.1 MAG: dihydrolipoyl dehydrogenase [Candidatus Rokubacteria bacterium]PYM71275.1 MAG: dihydrolipoyl dehydrogenase [Candidatus Rokubacteria bacterium]
MAAQRFDVVVVGTGPGGYVAAIRCAQLGLSVAAIEDDRPGGVCLNWGCIPTKALLRNAEIVGLFQRAEEFGVTVGKWTADYAQAVQRSRRVADRMAKGVEFLFRKNKITLVPGTGTLKARNVVEVKGKDGAQTLEAKAIILATGSEPRSLPGVTIDEKQVISSNGAVRIEATPASLIVIGAGAVGMEFADVYGAYGVPVTVLEALPRVLPIEDEEVSALLARVFSRRGMTIRTGVRVQKVSPGKAGLTVEIEAEGKAERLEAEQVLMAVGRASRTKGLGLEALGVASERGLVTVGPTMETSVKGIFAVGDMTGRQMLAHKAMAEGVVAAEAIAGRSPRPVDYDNVPSCTYCRPQVASIGLSEAKARTNGREIAVGRFPFTANGKAVALGETEGFLKVVADKRTGEILGVHIVGSEATEMIHEFAVGRTLEATLEEIIHTIHAHPTLSEAALEATLAALGQAIHI